MNAIHTLVMELHPGVNNILVTGHLSRALAECILKMDREVPVEKAKVPILSI